MKANPGHPERSEGSAKDVALGWRWTVEVGEARGRWLRIVCWEILRCAQNDGGCAQNGREVRPRHRLARDTDLTEEGWVIRVITPLGHEARIKSWSDANNASMMLLG